MEIKDVPDFEPEGFSLQIFKDRYAFTENETWKEACKRVAHQMALAENPKKIQKYEDRFYDVLVKNLFVPGGRIIYSSGRPNAQLANCFVLRSDLDSKIAWGGVLNDACIVSANGGGIGISFSSVRPENSAISGHRGVSSGPLGIMSGVNGVLRMIRAGGGRRGAGLASLSLDHPNVEDFLDAKLKNGELDMFNISLLSHNTAKFIDAVRNDRPWELSWGNKIVKTISAKNLWDRIVESAWQRSEPGFLNFSLVESESTISYKEKATSTNPCGEIPMGDNSACVLGQIVLPKYVSTKGDVDWPLLGEVVRIGVRFLDNVVSVNTWPLQVMEEVAQKRRRIGLGTTGLADMLIGLGINYGSSEGIAFIRKLYRFISKNAYEASVHLAIEKGSFPDCDPSEHVKTGYVKRMTLRVKSMIQEHGIRNCAILANAPCGTVSIISGNCSSGLEPIFAAAYYRNFWKGSERGRELVFHPLFANLMDSGMDLDCLCTSYDLSVEDHLKVQKEVQKHIDQACSKTVNIPKDYPVKDLSEIWLKYLPYLKGTTFYREGSRNFVDEDGVEHEPPLVAIPLDEAIKLYREKHPEAKTEAAHVDDCPTGTCEI